MKNVMNNRFVVLSLMVIAAAATRLLPHYPNFTAIGAVALFGGTYFQNKRDAFIVPFVAMFLTDLISGLHTTMIAVYAAFALTVVLGLTLREQKSILSVGLTSVLSSVAFFIITNVAFWLEGLMFPRTLDGLVMTFFAAVPFFHTTLFGDLFFVGVLFGSFELLSRRFPSLARA